ncbi:hypothetical protein HR080_04240 [Staphylococcus schleiferi subsp. coagulans]|uniref:hypothetical protein n=1 Tax=Staphylococcus coagulans TaxID=74706 RepID=UPI0015FA8217|nr:hypothetical protein [Staphylococcus coagulans]MBA8778568.1 hypothetical protein [Staphylococcus coagulans]
MENFRNMSMRHAQPRLLARRIRYIPYINRHVFNSYSMDYINHTITVLAGEWESTVKCIDIDEEVVYAWKKSEQHGPETVGLNLEHRGRMNGLSYQQYFEIKDFDNSKDYHLNIEGINQPFFINVNDISLGVVNTTQAVIEFDVTSMINAQNNKIELLTHFQSMDDTSDSTEIDFQMNLCQNLYILERANDRIENYEIDVKDNNQYGLKLQLQILDIDGAPLPSFILVDGEACIISEGDIDIDRVTSIHIPYSQDEHPPFILYIETEHETIAHRIEVNGKHEPIVLTH